jgi:hypothetical protein
MMKAFSSQPCTRVSTWNRWKKVRDRRNRMLSAVTTGYQPRSRTCPMSPERIMRSVRARSRRDR